MKRDEKYFKGCILGGAIGDALGRPIELKKLKEIKATYGSKGINNLTLNDKGIAEITDDTQMTLFTAEGILRANCKKGRCYIPAVVYNAYLRWYSTQRNIDTSGYDKCTYNSYLLKYDELYEDRGAGNTCLTSLSKEEIGSIKNPINNSKGCGGVMRVAPIGLDYNKKEAFRLGCDCAALTHGHPSGYISCLLYTSFKVLNEVKVSVGLLASLGVFITAAIVGLTTYYVFKLPPGPSLLLGATIASTDPAALIPVFKKIPIKNRLKQTVISESAFNDAFGAILFTSILTSITLSKNSGLLSISLELIFMILIGVLVGTIVALIGVSLSSDKRYGIFHDYAPIISIVIVVFAYEISERLGGSGYMSVFVSGLVAGNKKKFGLWVPDENYVAGLHFRENIATLARMSIFIILGTHLDLNSLLKYGLKSVIIVLVLMLVARPIVVLVCTLFDRKASWSKNEKLFMMWVRETGVIPAALSGIIVSTKVPGYEVISSVVFMTIIITLLVQASTTKIVAQKLDVLEDENIG